MEDLLARAGVGDFKLEKDQPTQVSPNPCHLKYMQPLFLETASSMRYFGKTTSYHFMCALIGFHLKVSFEFKLWRNNFKVGISQVTRSA